VIRTVLQLGRVLVAAWQLAEAEYALDVIQRATAGLRHRDDMRDCAPCAYAAPYKRRAHAARETFLALRRALRGKP
jgi:hypothetical protein